MALYLVRHAKAGERLSGSRDDALRPLSKKGGRQASKLAERFHDIPVPRVLASPSLRCVQTVAPLAEAHGLGVVTTEVLAEGASFLDTIELLEAVPDHTVLCSHGDVIPETIAALYRRGMAIEGPEDWRKCTTWVLRRGPDGFTSAVVWPPPPEE